MRRERERASIQISLSRPALFVVCLSVYLVVLVVLNKTAEASLSLFSCKSVFTWSTFSCAHGPLPPYSNEPTDTSRRFNASGDKSLDERQQDRCCCCCLRMRVATTLSFSAETKKTITRPMTLLVFRFLLFDLESDDQVITRGSAILVGVVYFHKMKQVPTITF